MPKAARPDFVKELGKMATNPVTGQKLQLETLIDFLIFNEEGEVDLGQGVKIRKTPGFFVIEDESGTVAKLKDKVVLNKEHYFTSKMLSEEKKELTSPQDISTSTSTNEPTAGPLGFRPPDFGVTILGSSHGFDCKGSTSGYILWINQRGVMVDPPPFSSQNLCEFGIPPNLIDKVILTHCHADHDSGIFQKILHSNKVELITTPTILASFLRKYSALTGLPVQSFRDLFHFRPVLIGAYIDLLGASFRFFYSYHSIPCIGLEISYCGKHLYFSGDTFYDPDALLKLHQKGVFTRERYESLVDIHWNKYDLILHEAGVPPIHTSTSVLKELPESVKEKMYLVHIAQEALPANCGLKVAKTGLKNTLVLDVRVNIDYTLQKLDLLSSIEFLNEIPLSKARDLIRSSKLETYDAGQVVIREGTFGDKFYIILSGIARISSTSKDHPFSKYAYAGDYFGETTLIQDGKRNADVVAYTQLSVMSIAKHEFKWVFGINSSEMEMENNINPDYNDICRKLRNLTLTRKNNISEFLNRNSCFGGLTESQKVQMNLFVHVSQVKKGTIFWQKGQVTKPKCCLFIFKEGSVEIKTPDQYRWPVKQLAAGHFIGDFPSLVAGKEVESSAICIEDCDILQVNSADLLVFLNKNPGLKLFLREEFIIY